MVIVEKMEFWPSALIGFVVMLILSVLPFPGPLVGGFISGFLFKEGIVGGVKVGLAAGIFGALVISALFIIFGIAFLGVLGLFVGLVGTIALVVLALYNGIFALIGGAIGGLVAEKFSSA
ncbi:MAG: DUF5518 domain-containing protein [Methanomicrobiales archaeon]|jgi:hypothetical protein|nr:DUF5518 domain-containing protein [Methanomicrobiales archaeon]